MTKKRERSEQEDTTSETPAEAATSSVYERGQTVIPKMVREALQIDYGTRLRWEVKEGGVLVMPMPKNPVQALRGALKGTGITFESFMAERQRERRREREAERA